MSGLQAQEKDSLQQWLKNGNVFSWHTYLKYLRDKKLKAAIDPNLQHYHYAAEKADSLMTAVYLVCNLSTLALALTVFFLPNLVWLPLVAFIIGVGWNYIDVIAGLVLALYQGKINDPTAAAVNIFSSLQLAAATSLFLAAFLGLASGSVVTITSVVAGFSFAAAIGISAFIEYRAMRKSEGRVQTLERLLENLQNSSPESPEHQGTDSLIQQLRGYIMVEREIAKSHKYNAKFWLACFMTMTMIATIGALPLVLPIAPYLSAILLIAAAVVCCISAIYRVSGKIQIRTTEPVGSKNVQTTGSALKENRKLSSASSPASTQEKKKTGEPTLPSKASNAGSHNTKAGENPNIR